MARHRLQNLGDRVARIKSRVNPLLDETTQAKRITGTRLQQIRTQLIEANPLCVECEKRGIVRLGTQADHVVALANGGRESLDPHDNRQMLCVECHAIKTQRDVIEAARRRGPHPRGA